MQSYTEEKYACRRDLQQSKKKHKKLKHYCHYRNLLAFKLFPLSLCKCFPLLSHESNLHTNPLLSLKYTTSKYKLLLFLKKNYHTIFFCHSYFLELVSFVHQNFRRLFFIDLFINLFTVFFPYLFDNFSTLFIDFFINFVFFHHLSYQLFSFPHPI